MMFRTIIRPVIVLALMLGATTLSVVAVPTALLSETRPKIDLELAVPKAFGDWTIDTSIVPLPPSPDQQSVLNQIYDQILSRTYVNAKGERVMLSITYGSKQNQQMRAHRQEVCYSAQGFRITGLERKELTAGGNTVLATQMVATQGNRVEPVTYWFTMGDEVVMTYWQRESVQFKYAMAGFIPDGYLFRISSISADADKSFARHTAFADALLATLTPELRTRLVGNKV